VDQINTSGTVKKQFTCWSASVSGTSLFSHQPDTGKQKKRRKQEREASEARVLLLLLLLA
jgi:hypothetical protein